MPPLRVRRSDIPLLVRHFLERHNCKRAGRPVTVNDEAMVHLWEYDWPGNVRELENAIQRAIVLSRGETIFPEHLPAKIQAAGGEGGVDSIGGGKTIREVERDIIVKTLKQTEGTRTRAAEILRIARRPLQTKIKEYGIDL